MMSNTWHRAQQKERAEVLPLSNTVSCSPSFAISQTCEVQTSSKTAGVLEAVGEPHEQH